MATTRRALKALALNLLVVGGAGAQTVSIYPQIGSATQPASSTGRVNTFTVINSTGFQVTLFCGSTGPITCSRLSNSYINPNSNLIDTAVYNTGAVGTGTVVLRTELVNGSVDSGYYNVAVIPQYQVSVTPKGATDPARTTNTGGYNAVFTITNTGYYSDTYTITCGTTGPVTCTSAKPTSSSGGTDTAFYNVGAVGSGTITLTASSSHASDMGWDTVLVRPAPITPSGPVVARNQCLTIAAGSSAAYECGDLRIVHPLPSTRTLGSLHTPTLFYNSQHANPFPSLNSDLALAANDRPDSIIAIARLKVGGSFVQRDRRAWAGTQWGSVGQAATRRVMTNFAAGDLATAFYPYQLELDRFVAGTGYATIRTDTGTIAIVNRANSPFGAGWWVDGFEQLQFQGDGSIMWIGGDGSVRRYQSAGTWSGKTWYVARQMDSPDTLSFDGTTYTRFLKAGGRVVFNTTGFHTQTLNRLGYASVFAPDGSNRLSTITLPPTGGAGRTYTFAYGGPNGTVNSITAPDSAGGSSRTTTIAGSALTGGGARITNISDPGITGSVAFGYGNGSYPSAITARTDHRGNTNTFFLGTGLRLVGDSLPVSGAQPIKRSFCPAEIRVWACGSGLTAPESTYTVYDGPRTDSVDVRDFWLDSLGQVTQIRDPYSNLTVIARSDARWPASLTRVQSPSGRVTAATYDGRGNLASVSDSNPYSDGRNAATQYAWNQTWDQLTQVTLPNGQVTQFGVDSTNGNRLWVQDSRGTLSRTTFQYYATGNGQGLLSAILPPAGGAQTSITYDVRGNSASVQAGGWTTYYLNDSIGRTKIVRTPIALGQYRNDTTTYDAADRAIRVSSYAVASADTERITVYNTYDAEGNVTQVQRFQLPDSTLLGWMTTQWTFDAANRPIVEVALDGNRDSTWYDPAGNVITVKTRNGNILTMTYDRMNRLTRRVVPAVTYSARTAPGVISGLKLSFDNDSGTHPYPWYPNNGTGLIIRADTATFAYDNGGRLVVANNGDARIHRAYFKNGSVVTDTLWIRDYADTSFKHVYGLRYTYDINGRCTVIHHPAQLATGTGMRDSVQFTYDGATGSIGSVTSLLGNQTSFLYDYRGEMVREALPGGITDSMVFDSLGRITLDRIANRSTSPYKDVDSLLRYATLRYTSGPSQVSAMLNGHGWRDTANASYTARGALTTLSYFRNPVAGDTALYGGALESQAFTVDPIGNVRRGGASSVGIGFGDVYTYGSTETAFFHNGTARIDSISDAGGNHGFIYDSAGNTVFFYQASVPKDTANDMASWYGADGHLRVAEWRDARSPNANWTNPAWQDVFEEYRYDALGRRVLVMSRQACWLAGGTDSTAAKDCSMSRIRRTVWDGAREMWEIQMPARTQDSLYIENDTGVVVIRNDTSWNGTQFQYSDPNPVFGRVAYTYAWGIDDPVAITRLKLVRLKTASDTAYWNPIELNPNWNWRGQADLGTFADGGMKTCTNSTHCVFVQWRSTAFASGLAPELFWTPPYNWSPYGWFGTLLNGRVDGTGTYFRRNRYVDPLTGRFAQEDPVGLAGGLNLYGFAASDPVNFGDPFGTSIFSFLGRWWGVAFGFTALVATGGFVPALEATAATAGGAALTAGVQSLFTGSSFGEAFRWNFNLSEAFLGGGALTAAKFGGGVARVGNNGLIQGFVESNNQILGCCALTFGSGSVFSTVAPGDPMSLTDATLTYGVHELGHTVQFIGMSALGRWAALPYLGLGGLELAWEKGWWDNAVGRFFHNSASWLGEHTPGN
jgi:RHS repeat-associated protein